MLDHSLFHNITTFVFDVDGVFTNSEVIVMENGDLVRTMNTRDGQAVKYALDNNYHVAIITKGFSNGVRRRFEILGIIHIYDKLTDKFGAYNDLKSILSINDDEILYMGDDIPDVLLIKAAAIGACPADATPEVKAVADFVSSRDGGYGCVREVIEKVMKIQGKWPS
jgi:3-deoxy-D-manno-octulosonate 8-phosphate phosphatase (KDO 8-P phosphatase)